MKFTSYLSAILCASLIITANVNVNAESDANNTQRKVVNSLSAEKPMPLRVDALVTGPRNNTTKTDSGRGNWVSKTVLDLKVGYKKDIAYVYETENSVVFMFDQSVIDNRVELMNVNDVNERTEIQESINVGIYSVEYVKPEAYNAIDSESMLAVTTYSTKIEQWFAWSGDWVSTDIDVDFNIFDAITVATFIFPGVVSNVVAVITFIASFALAGNYNLDGVNPKVKTRSWCQYYYLNRYGFVYNTYTAKWENWSQFGSRRGFRYSEAWDVTPLGAFVHYSYYINEPNSEVYPTNQNRVDKKSNFDINSIVIGEAIEGYESGMPYIDIYMIAQYKLN